MIGEKALDLIDECLDQHDDAITANTTLLEEALVRIEKLEEWVVALDRRCNALQGCYPGVARDEAEDRAFSGNGGFPKEPTAELLRLIVLDGDEAEEVDVPVQLQRRLRRIARGKG